MDIPSTATTADTSDSRKSLDGVLFDRYSSLHRKISGMGFRKSLKQKLRAWILPTKQIASAQVTRGTSFSVSLLMPPKAARPKQRRLELQAFSEKGCCAATSSRGGSRRRRLTDPQRLGRGATLPRCDLPQTPPLPRSTSALNRQLPTDFPGDCKKIKGQTAKVNSRNATFADGPLNQTSGLTACRGQTTSRQAAHAQLLIRRPLGFVVRRALLQNVDEVAACFGYAGLFTSHNVLCLDWMAINVCAGLIVGANRGTFQGNSGKQST
jgi:hypothetical protein